MDHSNKKQHFEIGRMNRPGRNWVDIKQMQIPAKGHVDHKWQFMRYVDYPSEGPVEYLRVSFDWPEEHTHSFGVTVWDCLHPTPALEEALSTVQLPPLSVWLMAYSILRVQMPSDWIHLLPWYAEKFGLTSMGNI